jgi:hypothetical protein
LKNTCYLIQKLQSLNLIEYKDDVDKIRRRHNEKHFRLTNQGIYQLFRNRRYYGVFTDQLSIKKGHLPISNIDIFLKHFGDNTLFNSFLYPYFEKQTIFDADPILLGRLFRYLHDCSEQMDAAAKIDCLVPQFSWTKVPGEQNNQFLTSLKEIFRLDNLENAWSLILEKDLPPFGKRIATGFLLRIQNL